MLCSPSRSELPLPVGEHVSSAAFMRMSRFLSVASSLKEAFCRFSHCCGKHQVIDKCKLIPLCTEITSISMSETRHVILEGSKFCLGDVTPYLDPCYLSLFNCCTQHTCCDCWFILLSLHRALISVLSELFLIEKSWELFSAH